MTHFLIYDLRFTIYEPVEKQAAARQSYIVYRKCSGPLPHNVWLVHI